MGRRLKMVFSLTDVLHLRRVKEELSTTHQFPAEEAYTEAQLVKIATVNDLMDEIGDPTIDEELDATIIDLTEIRDRP